METLDTVVGRLPCRLARGWFCAARAGGSWRHAVSRALRAGDNSNGSSETRDQAPRATQEVFAARPEGFFLTKSKLYQSAQEAANRADRYAFRDRRARKRQFRRLWIQRIGAAARLNGLSYSELMHGLKAGGVDVDRKILADLAVRDAAAFAQIATQAKQAAAKTA